MQTDIATAPAAESARQPSGTAGGGPAGVTAESFRQLIARLRTARRAARVGPPGHAPEEAAPQASAEQMLDIPAPPRRERDPGDEAGDTAIILLELMAATGLQPQERALAADTLLLLLPRMPSPQLVRVAGRVAIMSNPPPLLVWQLIRDPRPEVMTPVLERNAHISDLDMIDAASSRHADRLGIIARRRAVSPLLCAHVVACGDPAALLALLRNPGARIAHRSFERLAELAGEQPELLAPLATHPELPAAVAFDLFWSLPSELRRLILSRFLTDSTVIGKMLRLSLSDYRGLAAGAPREEGPASGEALEAALEAASARRIEEAALRFAEITGLAEATVSRILADRQGEPVAVLFKALGLSRTRFIAMMDSGGPGKPEDVQAAFDGLSYNKASMLLAYWDWFTRKTGPYAPRG